MAQYESITDRRPRFRYDLGIREATPAARNRYYSGQQLGIERDRLKEQKRQFEEAQAEQEKQNTISNVVGGAGTVTIQDGTNIMTNTGANKNMTNDIVYRFRMLNNIWYETE